MAQVDDVKKVYLIVHGQRHLLESMMDSLTAKFKRQNMQPASLEKAGEEGEYVAMLWPPRSPEEVIVSQITGKGSGAGMGAWSTVKQKELFRLPLRAT